MLKIAGYDVHTIETGRFALDGGAMFGVVPKVLWEKQIPADDQNRIPLALRVLLLLKGRQAILVDTGIGEKFPPKFQQMFAIDHATFSLEKSLNQHSLTATDISDVVLTHLHFDHAGGATRLEGDRAVPAFPNARYFVPQENWDWANNPTEKDRASYRPENFLPLRDSGQLILTEGRDEILPGIFPWLSGGHTVGQQLIQVKDAARTLIYCADIIPTSAHIPVPYVMGYDLFPVTTMEEKKEIMQQASDGDWIIVFEHDPYMPACTVMAGEKCFHLKEPVMV